MYKFSQPFSAMVFGVMAILGTFLCMACAIGGAVSLTQATMGVGIVAFGCAAGICARIFQAAARDAEARSQHEKEMQAMQELGAKLDEFLSRLV